MSTKIFKILEKCIINYNKKSKKKIIRKKRIFEKYL